MLGLGIWFARDAFFSLPSATWFALSLAAAGAAGAIRVPWSSASLSLAVALFGAGWATARLHETPTGSVTRFLDHGGERTVLSFEGLVTRGPEVPPPRGALARFLTTQTPLAVFEVRVDRLNGPHGWEPASGRLMVWSPPDGLDAPVGRWVRVTGLARGIAPPANPGAPDRRLPAAQRDERGTVTVSSSSLVSMIDPPASMTARALALGLRTREAATRRAAGVLDLAAPPGTPGSALVSSLLLGEREIAIAEVEGSFYRIGLAHLLAISGFHLAVLAWVGLIAVRLTGDRGWVEPAIVAALVAAYVVVVPAETPIVRSAVMVLVWLAAESMGRRYDRLTILAWTAAGLLVWRPMDLWSLGWQLSCGMTGVLIWLSGPAHDAVFGRRLIIPVGGRGSGPGRIMLAGVRGLVAVSVLCWLASLPLIWYSVGRVSPIGAAATIVMTPIIVPLMAVGFAAVLAGSVVPPIAWVAGGLIETLAGWTAGLASWLDRLPGSSVTVPPIHAAAAALATAAVLWWFAGRGRKLKPTLAVLAITMLALTTSGWWKTRTPAGVLRVETFAVGDGTCHLVRHGGDALLWDCGSVRAGIGVRELPAAVRTVGGWRVRRAVVSHADFDHYSALLDAGPALGIEEVLVGERFLARAREEPGGPAAACLSELLARGVRVMTVAQGDRITLGGATLTFLAPPPGCDWPRENDHSLVARLDLPGASDDGPARFLFTGDIESRAVQYLADELPGLTARVVEAPHHGSSLGEVAAWTGRLGPGLIVQSTGPGRVGSMAWEPLRRAGVAWRTTASDGAFRVDVARDGTISVSDLIRR